MERCGLALVAACALSTGCTLLFDGSEFRGGGDGGVPIDDRISAPTIAITERPTTLDAIAVTLVEPSVDAEGGEVTYTYSWTRSDEATEVTSDAVPPSQTAKGQTWEVTVTPRVGDRVGPGASASTEVVNSPPVVGSVGFSTYRPRADEVLRALPGAIYDPDGDAFTLQVRWERNGEEVATGPAASLNLGAEGFEPGDEVRVEVVATDGDASEPVSNTATVVPAHTAWRQLMPNRDAEFEDMAFMVHDVRNGRVVMYVNGQLWEHYLGTRNVDPAWVLLRPTGTPPPALFGAATVYDPTLRRALIVGGVEADTEMPNVAITYTLDLSRGAEAWGSFTAGGDAPEALVISSVVVDAQRQRLLAFSTFPFDEGAPTSDVLYQLDLRPGEEAWSQVPMAGDLPGTLLAPTWALDEERNEAYLAGGMLFDGIGPTGDGNLIYRLDLTQDPVEVTLLSQTLPIGSLAAAGAFDPLRRRAYFIHGMRAGDAETPQDLIYGFDVDAGEVMDLTADEPLPATGVSWASWDPATARVLLLGNLGGEGRRILGSAWLSEDGAWEAVDWPGLTSPVPVAEPGYFLMDQGGGSSMFVVGGRNVHGMARGGVYRFAFASNAFERVDVAADPTHGSPEPGWGYGPLVGEDRLTHRFLVGGVGDDGLFSPVEVWLLERTMAGSWRWRRPDVALADQPVPREGAVVMTLRPACPPDQNPPLLSYFGGLSGPTVNDEMRHFDCSSGIASCDWRMGTHDVTMGGRAYAGVNSYPALGGTFGGLDDSRNGTNTLWGRSGDCDDWSFSEWFVDDPPPGRFGHTYLYASHGEVGGEHVERVIVFGGKDSWEGDTYFNDAWEYVPGPEPEWRMVTLEAGPDVPLPAPRFHHAAAWDPTRRRLIVFGGEGEDGMVRSDVWELRVVE
jgi:hypothetical protein